MACTSSGLTRSILARNSSNGASRSRSRTWAARASARAEGASAPISVCALAMVLARLSSSAVGPLLANRRQLFAHDFGDGFGVGGRTALRRQADDHRLRRFRRSNRSHRPARGFHALLGRAAKTCRRRRSPPASAQRRWRRLQSLARAMTTPDAPAPACGFRGRGRVVRERPRAVGSACAGAGRSAFRRRQAPRRGRSAPAMATMTRSGERCASRKFSSVATLTCASVASSPRIGRPSGWPA